MSTPPPLPATIDGAAVTGSRPMGHGHAGPILRLNLADGRVAVAKTGGGLAVEAAMLRDLAAAGWPVPPVWHAEPGLLVMAHVAADGRLDAPAQEHAAEVLARLHAVPAAAYGYDYDTTIGPLYQPNPPSDDWHAFFAEHRLLHTARLARDEGAVDAAFAAAVERLAGRLPSLLGPPAPPALIHGDLWTGNVLVRGGRLAAVIDPAMYRADPEVELAFTTLFGTFGEPFFRRYQEIRPLRPGFHEARRPVYTLYPLLVHIRIFGSTYVAQAAAVLRRFAG